MNKVKSMESTVGVGVNETPAPWKNFMHDFLRRCLRNNKVHKAIDFQLKPLLTLLLYLLSKHSSSANRQIADPEIDNNNFNMSMKVVVALR